jgi:TonB family protein
MLHISKLSLGILGLALLLSACSSNPLPGPDAARPSAEPPPTPSPSSKGSEPRPGYDAVAVSSPAPPPRTVKSGVLIGCLTKNDAFDFVLRNDHYLKGIQVKSVDDDIDRDLETLVGHKVRVTGSWKEYPSEDPRFFEAVRAQDISNSCAAVHDGLGGDPPRAGENGYGTPVCVYCPQPGLSDEAIKAKHFNGVVVLEALVTADGRATNVHVIKAVGLGLDIKAVEIVPTWRFKPALGPDGRAASVVTRIECKFRSDSTVNGIPK